MSNDDNIDVRDIAGKRRFSPEAESTYNYITSVKSMQDNMINALPSNYSKTRNLNISVLYDIIARELGLVASSATDIANDMFYDTARIEYLFQILGDSLFLGDGTINSNISDKDYRDFLIKVKKSYLAGSRKDDIEKSVSDIIGLPIELKEAYLYARKNGSEGLKDTHKMFFDVFMDDAGNKAGKLNSSDVIGNLLEDIRYFINLIKPAHVLYDTRLIWTDTIYESNGIDTPIYNKKPLDGNKIYGAKKLYIVSSVTHHIEVLGTTPDAINPYGEDSWYDTGMIKAFDRSTGVMSVDLGVQTTRLVVSRDSTVTFHADYDGTAPDPETALVPGVYIRYYGDTDCSTTSDIIGGDWEVLSFVRSVDSEKGTFELLEGSTLVYNEDTPVYIRDADGEYRTELQNISRGDLLAADADVYTEEFKFLHTPKAIKKNFFRQFDRSEQLKPSFIDNVSKDTPEYGSSVVVEDGVARVVLNDAGFYKVENQKSFKAVTFVEYALIVSEKYKGKFVIDPRTERVLTEGEALERFKEDNLYKQYMGNGSDVSIKITRVGKLVEQEEGTEIQTIADSPVLRAQSVSSPLMTLYEDTRNPEGSAFIGRVSGFLIGTGCSRTLSCNKDVFGKPLLPVMSNSGSIATVEDISVTINGEPRPGVVVDFDPWEGTFELSDEFRDSQSVEVFYYHGEIYPSKAYKVFDPKIVKHDTGRTNTDLPATFSSVDEHTPTNKLLWPFPVNRSVFRSNSRDYQMDRFPLLANNGDLASPADIKVFLGETVYEGTLYLTGTNTAETSLAGVSQGDTLVIDADNYRDSTLVYTIKSVSDSTLFIDSLFPSAVVGTTKKCRIIRYSEKRDVVEKVRPLLGHVRINFLPPAGTYIKIEYHHTHEKRLYAMVPDSVDSGYTSDSFYGSRIGCSIVSDPVAGIDVESPLDFVQDVLEIGYRYRAFNLESSSVLNSSDTLIVGNGKETGTLNDVSVTFSPERSDDVTQPKILNDKFLYRDLDPHTKLRKGTPIFPKTFTSSTRYVQTNKAKDSSYLQGSSNGRDISASFKVISKKKSGLVDKKSVRDVRKNKSLSLYSGLKVVEFRDSGVDKNLSTIKEGDRSIPFSVSSIEEYFPNREMRLGAYLDYINRVPVEYKSGTAVVMNRSKIIKTASNNFKAIRRGDSITFIGVSYNRNGRPVSGELTYTVVKIIDHETIELNEPFGGTSGEYNYELSRDFVVNVDTTLGEVCRELVVDADSYAIPSYILQSMPAGYKLKFRDPDTDTIPQSPGDAEALGIKGPKSDPNPLVVDDYDTYKIPNILGDQTRSYSEAEYLQRWRNWDQDKMILSLPGRIEEDPIYLQSDADDGLTRFYWDVNKADVVKMVLFGTAIITSEQIDSAINPEVYEEGLLPIDYYQYCDIKEAIEQGEDPVDLYPEYRLADERYNLNQQVIYELLKDGTLKSTEIREFSTI